MDHELGGFCEDVRDDGSRGSDNKGGWYQGLGIWVFAHFANRMGGEERYLEAARRAWQFTLRHGRDARGHWVMNMARTGATIEGATSVLTDVYLAHGLVELFHADSTDEYFDLARAALLQVRERIERPAPSASVPSYTEPHSVNGMWGAFLHAVSDYLRIRPDDAELAALSDLCLQAVLTKHLDPGTGLIVEAVAPDGTPYTGRQRNLIKPGAGAETCTAIMIEADRRGDRDLRRTAAEMLRTHFDAGWDATYGGIYYETDLDGRPVEDRKDAWAQAEFMRGLATAGATEADAWIGDAYARIHEWAFATYAAEPDDTWRISATREGRLTDNRRLDLFHHPRMLLSVLHHA